MNKSGKWEPEEDEMLRLAVEELGAKQWRLIAEHVPGRTSIQCLHRWTKILKPGLVKGSWTAEEDEILRNWVLKKKGNLKWAEATKEIHGRSGKQIRERWFNILNPKINKNKWTEDEERLLFQLYQTIGPKWCSLVTHFEGRTENSIKNRFYSTLRRVATEHKRDVEKELKKLGKVDPSCTSSTPNEGSITINKDEMTNDEFYIPNPQVAKTEELLRFLPMVIESLKAYPEEGDSLPPAQAKSVKRVTKRKGKSSNIIRKRRQKPSTAKVDKAIAKNKRKKVEECPSEEEKFSNEERETKGNEGTPNHRHLVSKENLCRELPPMIPFDNTEKVVPVLRENIELGPIPNKP